MSFPQPIDAQRNALNMIAWTLPMLERFEVAYSDACKANAEVFTFDGNQFVRAYARYLIEYLRTQFNQMEVKE